MYNLWRPLAAVEALKSKLAGICSKRPGDLWYGGKTVDMTCCLLTGNRGSAWPIYV